MKIPTLFFSLAFVLLLSFIPSAAFSSATKLSPADSIWQSVDQTPNLATSAMSATQMQMTRPLRYSVDTAIFKMKFSDTATIDTVDLIYITHKKKSILQAAHAALTTLGLKVKPDQIDQWVYHRMICFHMRHQNDQWFEHLHKGSAKEDSTITLPFMTKEMTPEYPLGARGADTVRSVWPLVLIDERGQVRLATIQRSSGDSRLDDAALSSAILSKYRPGKMQDKNVPVWAYYEVRFMP